MVVDATAGAVGSAAEAVDDEGGDGDAAVLASRGKSIGAWGDVVDDRYYEDLDVEKAKSILDGLE